MQAKRFIEEAFERIDMARAEEIGKIREQLEDALGAMKFDASATAPRHIAVATCGFAQAKTRFLELIDSAFDT